MEQGRMLQASLSEGVTTTTVIIVIVTIIIIIILQTVLPTGIYIPSLFFPVSQCYFLRKNIFKSVERQECFVQDTGSQ